MSNSFYGGKPGRDGQDFIINGTYNSYAALVAAAANFKDNTYALAPHAVAGGAAILSLYRINHAAAPDNVEFVCQLPKGERGLQGTPGTNGASITSASYNSTSHIMTFLKDDGSSIPVEVAPIAGGNITNNYAFSDNPPSSSSTKMTYFVWESR